MTAYSYEQDKQTPKEQEIAAVVQRMPAKCMDSDILKQAVPHSSALILHDSISIVYLSALPFQNSEHWIRGVNNLEKQAFKHMAII